jgi:hypothetical protein
MTTYRDVDVGLRIDTLEAKLAERDAALVARDVELRELRADLAGTESRNPSVGARRLTGLLAIGGVLTSAILGVAYLNARAETAREIARAAERDTDLWEGKHNLTRDIAEKREKLEACTRLLDIADKPPPPPPPHALFGTSSDRASIEAALGAAAQKAEKCQIAFGSRGTGRVRMVFDSMQGNVESASLDYGPLSGSNAETCIVEPFRHVHVDAFKGGSVTLIKEVTIK